MKESTETKNGEEDKKMEIKDFGSLISELNKAKEDGNNLYKQKKIDEAKDKFKEGIDKFEKEYSQIKQENSHNPQYNELLTIYNKLLSNLALCHYKQGDLEKSIEYDKKILEIFPKFAKSIVRLFNCYSKLGKIEDCVYYGDQIKELDQETRDKFKNILDKIEDEKKKLKNIQDKDVDKMNKNFSKYVFPALILLLAILLFLLVRNNKK